MNREIKFRIFDSTNKKMITNDVCFQIALSVDGTIKAGITGDVLMQYTGLKDTNGKEIYEGDVLKASNSIIKIVFKGRGYEGIYLNKEEMNELPIQNNNYLHWQIIGNIYENPELTQSSE